MNDISKNRKCKIIIKSIEWISSRKEVTQGQRISPPTEIEKRFSLIVNVISQIFQEIR